MNKMRIRLILILFILTLAACGGTDSTPTEQQEPTPETAVSTEAAQNPDSEASVVGIPEPTQSDHESGATIYVYDFGDMILHAFINPPAGIGNGTYIIEGETELVLIDSHFSQESAEAFRGYVDTLNKPINRIFATHEHPDHINGLGTAFADVSSYASAEVVELAVAEEGITIDNIVEAGTEMIDGIQYEYEIYKDAESEEALVIKLPEYAVIAVGDLVYNKYHMVMNPNIPNWLDQLAQLEAMSQYQLILPGHGAMGETAVYAEATNYLETAWDFYLEIEDPDEFRAALVDAFPEYEASFLLGLAAQRMYPKPENLNINESAEIETEEVTSEDDGSTEAAEAVTEELTKEEQLIAHFTKPSETNGDVLILLGQVLDVNGEPVPDTAVEIWQTDSVGVYDHPQDPGTANRDLSFQFYGTAVTDSEGYYVFRTVTPGEYEPRPRHIHFKVIQNGATLLTSQFYFSQDIAQVENEGMFAQVGDSGDLLLLQLVQGDGMLLANGRIVVDTAGRNGDLPLTPSQAEGPYYPVVNVAEYDNDLTTLP